MFIANCATKFIEPSARPVRRPKIHITDTGLAAALMGLDADELARQRPTAPCGLVEGPVRLRLPWCLPSRHPAPHRRPRVHRRRPPANLPHKHTLAMNGLSATGSGVGRRFGFLGGRRPRLLRGRKPG